MSDLYRTLSRTFPSRSQAMLFTDELDLTPMNYGRIRILDRTYWTVLGDELKYYEVVYLEYRRSNE